MIHFSTRAPVPTYLTPGSLQVSDNEDLMAEFQEFLTQKRASEKEAEESEDFEVEIWDEKGRGVRTRRSHAKPFLQSLGLDPDTTPAGKDGDNGGDDKGGDSKTGSRKSTGKQSSGTQASGTVRKYFTKPAGK
jgi:hypothetical protein